MLVFTNYWTGQPIDTNRNINDNHSHLPSSAMNCLSEGVGGKTSICVKWRKGINYGGTIFFNFKISP